MPAPAPETRVEIPVTQSSVGGTVLPSVNSSATLGNKLYIHDPCLLLLFNTDFVDRTVDLYITYTIDGVTIANNSITIPTYVPYLMGPFNGAHYAQEDGFLYLDFDSDGIVCSATHD